MIAAAGALEADTAGAFADVGAAPAAVDTQYPYINQYRRRKQNSMMNHRGLVRQVPALVVVVVVAVVGMVTVVVVAPAVVFGSHPHD